MRIVQIWRYPVKSLAGEPLRSTPLDFGGLPHDRRHALIDSDPTRAGKPLNDRHSQVLLGYGAFVKDGVVRVRTPAGAEHTLDERAWLDAIERDLGKPVTLRSSQEPIHDDSDILVVSAASLRALADEYGAFVNPLRFRPNLIVDDPGLRPFAEQEWLGARIAVGGALLETSSACLRCVVTTIDPETLSGDPAFLRLLAQRHEAKFGVYCKVLTPGEVRLGDELELSGAAEVTA